MTHQCPHCLSKFARLRCLTRHIGAKHVINENTTCPKCSQRFHTKFQKDLHVNSIKGCKVPNPLLPSQPPPLLLLPRTHIVLESQIEHEIILGEPVHEPTHTAPPPEYEPPPPEYEPPPPAYEPPPPAYEPPASEQDLASKHRALFLNRGL